MGPRPNPAHRPNLARRAEYFKRPIVARQIAPDSARRGPDPFDGERREGRGPAVVVPAVVGQVDVFQGRLSQAVARETPDRRQGDPVLDGDAGEADGRAVPDAFGGDAVDQRLRKSANGHEPWPPIFRTRSIRAAVDGS